MDTSYQSFSVRNSFYTQNIPKGHGACVFEEFIAGFKQEHPQRQVMHVVKPTEEWQLCEYEGHACVGVLTVYQINEDGPEEWMVAFVGVSLCKVSDHASAWLRKNRQKNTNGDKRLIVNAELHGQVQPVQKPNPEEVWCV